MGTKTQGRTTLSAVATQAGVSVATVSKVVNDRSDVSDATRARVRQLLDEHGYLPRTTHRLPATTTDVLELAFEGDLHAYTAEVLQGVLDAAAESGVPVVVTCRPIGAGPADADARGWARGLSVAGRRALIAVTSVLSSSQLSALAGEGISLVVIDPLEMPNVDVTSVGSTNFSGGVSAVQHLLDLGHRRIAYLGGHSQAACNQARMHGYRAAMEAAGVPVPDGFVRSSRFIYSDGVDCGLELLNLPSPPTAIFAGSDEIAVGVMEAARRRGLDVPADLSIVGFDDTQLARMSSPPLTTVRQPLAEMGRLAVRTALRLSDGGSVDSHHVELATDLILRESTAPPSR
ncbi:LacI family transcriptional regulator [Humibacillus sp. DSM 29435]|uniref:LacI family DNA-binding transcriptional regulator n=1 Tax=Humibacillus sp. DSM 29435 TaxID=1869167 RepID=UPI0008721AB4|nr:substrate-binding domain-containing protein [Humibacillus sp. DSM 29435]OFE15433.1 LacI family transcriptional regulator [Humibacillus sp. DSM 29435]